MNALMYAPSNATELMSYAKFISQSQLVPSDYRGKPHDILVAVSYGAEIGMPPISALQNIYVVKGRPTLKADAMVGAAMRHPECMYIRQVKSTSEVAIYETLRINPAVAGNPEFMKPVQYTFTYEDAKKAGITGNATWDKYRPNMLMARCKSKLVKDAYPDVLSSAYVPEDFGMTVTEDNTVVDFTVEVEETEKVREKITAKSMEQILERAQKLDISHDDLDKELNTQLAGPLAELFEDEVDKVEMILDEMAGIPA